MGLILPMRHFNNKIQEQYDGSAYPKVSMMPLPASSIFINLVSMSRKEIGLAHLSPQLSCLHDTHLHEFHAHCICASIYFFWLHLASLSHDLTQIHWSFLTNFLHLDSKWFLPPHALQIFPKAGHSPLSWE